MRPMVIMRWFSRVSVLYTTLIGLKHRIFFALSVITTKIGQFKNQGVIPKKDSVSLRRTRA
jgi:hypothetical protein